MLTVWRRASARLLTNSPRMKRTIIWIVSLCAVTSAAAQEISDTTWTGKGVAGLNLSQVSLSNWAAGGEFLAQVAEPGSAFIAGTPLSLFLSTPVQNLVLPGAVFLLDLTALLFFLSDIYALGTKPRLIFIFNISALLLTAAALCGPAATPATVALAAVPSAVLLPFMFVRIHRAIALPLYLLLLASAVISAVLQ